MMEENEDTDRNEDEDEVHRRTRSMNMVKIQNQNVAGDVGGTAWTCDGQTNTINFIQFVCQSPWLLDAARDEYLRVAGRKEVGGASSPRKTNCLQYYHYEIIDYFSLRNNQLLIGLATYWRARLVLLPEFDRSIGRRTFQEVPTSKLRLSYEYVLQYKRSGIRGT